MRFGEMELADNIIRGARPTTHRMLNGLLRRVWGIILVHPPISGRRCIKRVFVHGAE
jgi:hypothetical protein